jgi:hypothetical protein
MLKTVLASSADLATEFKKEPFKDPVRPRSSVLLWLLVPLTPYFAITSQSLWIDEGFTVWFASHDTFPSFFHSLVGLPGSPGDPQMLFYLSYMWGWVKIFGRSEEALRAANIPFFLLFIASLAWASRRLLRQPFLWVPFCLSPFVWFYLNEARPYAALIAFSTAALVSLLAYVVHPGEYRSWAPWCCLIAVLFACGSHILGVFLIPSMVALVAETARTNPSFRHCFWRDWWRPFLSCLPAFAILAGFNAWASSYGVNKSGPDPRFADLVLVAGEFLGFRGVSPPRKQLQTGIPLDVFSSYWPLLLIGVAAIVAVTVVLLRTRPPKVVRTLSVSLLAGIAIAFAISWFADLHVSGRHMAVLFPLLPLIGMFWLGGSSRELPRQSVAGVTFVLALAWSISDARMLLLPQYKKDDYRGAASIALRTAEITGAEILWAADPHVAHYYGIGVMKDHHLQEIGSNEGLTLPFRHEATEAGNWSFEDAQRYSDAEQKPVILVLSDSDMFDTKGGWEALLRQRQPVLLAKLNSFSIYQLNKGSSGAASGSPPPSVPRLR